MKSFARLFLLAYSLPLAIYAQERTWLPPSGSWDTPANWSGGTVPTAANNAQIGNGAATLGAGVSGTANQITVSGTAAGIAGLTISGGYLSSANAFVGSGWAGTATVTVSGGTWNNSGLFTVGGSGGFGTVSITGGTLFSGSGSVLSTGNIYVSGAGTFDNNGHSLYVGSDLLGGIIVGAGGMMKSGDAFIGGTEVSSGTAGVSLLSGTWNSTGVITVGKSGKGALDVYKGQLTSTSIRVAEEVGSEGTLTIGIQEFLGLAYGTIVTGQISEGAGSGTLIFQTGTLRATGNQADFISGFEAGDVILEGTSSDTLALDTNGFNIGIQTTMSGTGWFRKVGSGTLTISGSQAYTGVTFVDNGTLEISSSGAIDQSLSIIVGMTENTNSGFLLNGGKVGGALNLTAGTNSSVTGLMNSGTMNLTALGVSGASFTMNAGLVTAPFLHMGMSGTSNSTLTVTGGTMTSGLATLGATGSGTSSLNISGGYVSSGTAMVGFVGSNGVLSISGGTYDASVLNVGYGATSARFAISGGLVSSGTALVGAASPDTIALVTGGTWTSTNGILVGAAGSATMTVGGTGVVSTSTVTLGDLDPSALGTLNIGTGGVGGMLRTELVTTGTGSGAIVFDGGTIQARANKADFLSGFDPGDVTIRAGGAFIDSSIYSIGISTALSGTGGLTKLGSGTLALSGSNSYTGGTHVVAGLLQASNANAFVQNTAYQVDGGTLDLNNFNLTMSRLSGTGGNVALGSAALNVNQAANTSYGGAIVGSGGLTKSGTGALTLTGSNSYTGGTTIKSGTLVVNGGRISHSGTNMVIGGTSGDSGSLLILNGGQVSNALGILGNVAGSAGTATVTSGTWSTVGSILVGNSGSGSLLVNGGNVSAGSSTIGQQAGSSGTAAVTSGTWQTTNTLGVGNSGTGYLLVNGGVVANGSAIVGGGGAGRGSVTVTSGTLTNSSFMQIGQSGTGSLLVNGGYVSAGSSLVGENATGVGDVTVSSGTLALTSGLTLGRTGMGSLLVNGGLVSSNGGMLGDQAGARGIATVTSGTWATSGLNVGNSGTGSLLVNGGVIRSTGGGVIGSGATGRGSATISSGTWQMGGSLTIGSSGSGSMLVSGGLVSDSSASVGAQVGSFGSATVTGGTWSSTLTLTIGGGGIGSLLVNGGLVTNLEGLMGTGAASMGTATVTSGSWVNSGMTIGGDGTADLLVNGGFVSSGTQGVFMGLGNGSLGTATVSSGTWANARSITVGVSGSANLLVSGGLVSTGSMSLGSLASGVGTVTLSGGVLQTRQIWEGSGAGSLIFNGGTLRATGTQANFLSDFEAGDVVINSGGALIDSNGFTIGISTVLSGTGGLTKLGAGTLALTGSNNYSGATQVSAGNLAVNGVNSGTGTFTVANGATLSGTGTIAGGLTLQNGGTLETGNSIGTLTVGSAVFESGSIFSLEGNGTFFDSLVVNGGVTLQAGALISFDLLGPLTAASYTLITATGGLDGTTQFTLSGSMPAGYLFQYSGTSLSLVQAPPVIGDVTATPNDTTIITGGTTSVVVTVGNDGPTGGSDLEATVTGDGTNVSGSGTTTVAPGTTGTSAPDLAFSSTTIGVQTGTVTVTDPNATNSPQEGTVTVNVLDHADPILTVSGGNSQSVIVGATGITATLNLANGTNGEANLSPMDVGNLSAGLSGTTGSAVIGSGASANYTASLNTGTVGASQNQVFSLDAGDQQSLPGANALSTYSATVALNVYGHAEPSISGTTLNLGYIHEGYTSAVVSNTLTVTNGASGDYIVDLKADAVTDGDITVNGISGVAAGDSAGISASLGTGVGVGAFSQSITYTYADDSSLAGASSNVGSDTLIVSGQVYSGQGVWNKVGGGSWGTLDSGFGVNWEADGGSPGLDAAFTSTDTATFGTAGSGVVTLDGAAPSLKAITFDNATDSYALLQGTGGTITLNGGTNTAVIQNLNGNHFIEAPLQLATNTLFTVANTADLLTISGPISGSGNVEVGGSGRTILTQNQSYAGTTTVTSGVLASRNLTGGAVNVNGGLFSPGNEGTISTITVSTLNLNGGGLEFDLGTPSTSDGIIVTGTTTLNTATQFTFLNAGFEAGLFTLVQSGTLANFGNLSGLTFVSDIDGLQGLFGVDGNTLYFRGFTEDTIFTGPVLSNYAPYLIPTFGKFLVDGPVTTWPEDLSNTIDSLIFKNGSSLFVFNDLTVTSGNFTVRRGSATIDGGRVVVPGDFNLLGKGTLIAGSEFAIGGDANVNGGNLVIDGLFNAGGNMNVHSTVTVNGNAQIAGNLNTDDSEIVVNGIFGIGKSANINNGSFLQVNQGGVMNVVEATNIHAGSSAQINGLLTSPQVNVSGLLKGTGVIAGNLWNNGVVAPGNSPGVLTVNGNYVQTGNGTLQIELGDLLLVSGNASLAGRLQFIAAGKLKYGQQITFLQAGSISGEFDEVAVPNPSKNRGRVLTEGGTGTLLIAPTSYTLVAETSNQRKVARALDGYIPEKNNDREVVSIALDLQTAEQYPAAFDQIAPTYYESLGNITIEQAFVQSQQLNQRLSAVRLGARGFQAIGIESPLMHDKDGKSVFEAKDAKKNVEVETATNWNIWAMGNGTFARVTGIGQLPNYNFNSGGFLVGGDYRWSENFATGLFGGYQYTWADAGDAGNTQINSALFGGYATYQSGGFYADGIVGGGYNGYRVRRGINFSTVDRTARSQPNGGQFNASLNLGYDWEIGKFTLGPIAGVQYAYAGIAPFSETGADSLNLRVAQQNVNSMRTTFGGRIAYSWNVTDKIALIPEVRMFWQHEFLNNPRNISSALDGGSGSTFGYETSALARDSVFAGAGISAQFGDRWNAFFYWNVDFGRQDYFGNSISGGLNWKF